MLTDRDKELLEESYFNVLEKNDWFYKIQSNNVKSEWIILMTDVPGDKEPVVVYRKKFDKGVLFKLESTEPNVETAIRDIKRYDETKFEQRMKNFNNKKNTGRKQ